MSKSGFDRDAESREVPRVSEYNFSIDASSIVSAIGRIKDARRPRPLQTDLAQRNPNQVCKYHGTHGHKIEDCEQLREKVVRLFNECHLREFLSDRAENHFRDRDANRKNELEELQHVIHKIVGGVDIPQGPTFKRTKVTITRKKCMWDYLPEDTLSFNNEDVEGQSHNDSLVISILMIKIQVKRVLADPGSSASIIRSRVVEQLDLQDQIVPAARVLNDFNMASKTAKGKIILPVNVAGTIHETKFHIIDGDMRYNALLYDEQPASREMFIIDEAISVSVLSSMKGLEGKQEVKLQP
ncbi:uncharacterized protein [Nicotiana sylvestris]|uniref:uncharacterized protein n=1 Tax=Nicotiana sylvestris TaxID=4096 RepID=UPI00388CDD5D